MGVVPVIGGGPGGMTTVAALRDASGTLLCSGTLVGDKAILTAGHCARTDLARVDVDGQSFSVASMVAYPDAAATEDVAVVFLTASVNEPSQAIGLGWGRFEVRDGHPVYVMGFGTTDANGTVLPASQQVGATTITDATCEHTSGCNVVGGELAAGGMGIDACPGDSGGPLMTSDFELVGVVSRGIATSAKACGDGSIYARADAIADWLQLQTHISTGSAPRATPSGDDWLVVPADPHPVAHDFAIVSSDGEAHVKADGTVRICGSGTTVVSVTDATDGTRSLNVSIETLDSKTCDFTGFDDGGCCSTHGGSPWLVALLVIGWLRWPTSGRSARRARTTSGSARPTGSAACRPAIVPTPATSSARSRAGTATSRS